MGGNRGRLLGDGIYPKALHDLVLLKKKLFDPTVLLRYSAILLEEIKINV